MKFIHLADLHIGKRVNAFPMLEDQRYILREILSILREEQPDGGVILAGDIYDKPVPAADAVELFDDFLYQLSLLKLRVFIIAGNHDSPERIAFGNRLMDRSGIYLSPVYDGQVRCISCEEPGQSPVDVYLLPFLKPSHVRRFYPEEEIESYTDALHTAIRHMAPDPSHRNLLVTHQFVTGSARSDSEEISVGGTDNVSAAVFAPFDYVALGHIHGPQMVHFPAAEDNADDAELRQKDKGDAHSQACDEALPGASVVEQKGTAAPEFQSDGASPVIRYAGTPLKYSFSEVHHRKSVTIVDIGPQTAGGHADVRIRTRDLHPLRDMRELRGRYEELTLRANYQDTATEDYLHVTLTDEIEIPDAARHLQVIYPNLMKLDYDNARTRGQGSADWELENLEQKSPLQLFSELFEKQNHKEMTEEQLQYMTAQLEHIWEAER